jgi:hypothetical protein
VKTSLLCFVVSLAATSVAAACSSDLVFGGGSGSGASGGGGGSPDGGATTSGGAGPGGAAPTSSTTGGGGAGGEGPCVPKGAKTALRDLDMVLMVDRSGSMTGPKFDVMRAELDQVANEPWAPGTSFALDYHPASAIDICPVQLYDPPEVPLTPVPSSGAVISASLMMQFATGASPIQSVVAGALQYASTRQTQQPSHVVVAVLMADTDPNACNGSYAEIVGLVQSALAMSGVRTFAVGFEGITIASLNAVAAAGGTGQAVDLTAPGAMSMLHVELEAIRRRAVPCELDLPPTPDGVTFDPDAVFLGYTPGGMGPEEYPAHVANENACGQSPGWYWDDPVTRTKLVLCSATCDAIKADVAPALQVLFGCTELDP